MEFKARSPSRKRKFVGRVNGGRQRKAVFRRGRRAKINGELKVGFYFGVSPNLPFHHVCVPCSSSTQMLTML